METESVITLEAKCLRQVKLPSVLGAMFESLQMKLIQDGFAIDKTKFYSHSYAGTQRKIVIQGGRWNSGLSTISLGEDKKRKALMENQ